MKHFYRICTIGLLSFMLPAGVFAQANNWVKQNGFDGTKRERAIGISIGNRGYIGFGHDSGVVVRSDWWEYDPGSDSWTQKAANPGGGRRDAIAFTIGTKGYVGTGDNSNDAQIGNPLSDFWEYNPATNVWTQKAAYPGGSGFGVYYATGFSVNGKGYVCCGKQGPNQYLDELWEYNPGTNSWAQKSSYPGGQRYGLSSFTSGNNAYVGLGVDYNVMRTDFWKYNPFSDSWTQVNSLPSSPRYSASTFSIGTEGFVVCGTDGGYKAELWEYSTTYNIWVQRADFGGGARRSAVAFSIGNRGYCGTGKDVNGSKRDLWEYTPLPPLGVNDPQENISVAVFPNPMSVSSTVAFHSVNGLKEPSLKLFDVNGKILREEKLNDDRYTLQRNDLPSGIYFISIFDNGRSLHTAKLIIQ